MDMLRYLPVQESLQLFMTRKKTICKQWSLLIQGTLISPITKMYCHVVTEILLKVALNTYYMFLIYQWNISNPTHQETREMCRIVLNVWILRFYFSSQKYYRIIIFCRMSQKVGKLNFTNCTISTDTATTVVIQCYYS